MLIIGCILMLLLATQAAFDEEDEEFFGGEYDPDNMFEFDQSKMEHKDKAKHERKSLKERIRNTLKDVGSKVKDVVKGCDYAKCEKNITELQKKVEECKKAKESLLKKVKLLEGDSKEGDKHTPVLMPYIKSYVRFLQNQFSVQVSICISLYLCVIKIQLLSKSLNEQINGVI